MASQLPTRKTTPNKTKRPQITSYQYKERCSPRSHTLPHSIQPIHCRPPTTPNSFHPHNFIRRRLNHCHHTQKPRYRNINHSRLPNTNPNLAGRKPDDSIPKQILHNPHNNRQTNIQHPPTSPTKQHPHTLQQNPKDSRSNIRSTSKFLQAHPKYHLSRKQKTQHPQNSRPPQHTQQHTNLNCNLQTIYTPHHQLCLPCLAPSALRP